MKNHPDHTPEKSARLPLRFVMAGNPNTGKTSLFNALTGSAQSVGNYPGVTVEKKVGRSRFGQADILIEDLPGIYSLSAYSPEETVARKVLLSDPPDVVIIVVDASNLERNLYLTAQILEMGLPAVVALNMTDVATRRGCHIDTKVLGELLGVPVIETVGNREEGAAALFAAATATASQRAGYQERVIDYGQTLEPALHTLSERIQYCPEAAADSADAQTACQFVQVPRRWLAVKCLAGDETIARYLAPEIREDVYREAEALREGIENQADEPFATLLAERRFGWAAGIVRRVIRLTGEARQSWTDAIDNIVCSRSLGFIFVAFAMYSIFYLTFAIADGWLWVPVTEDFSTWRWDTPVNALDMLFSSEHYFRTVTSSLSEGPLKSLLTDGLIAGVGGVIVFVPVIFVMFFLVSALEATGYIARMAFVMDRGMRYFGLQGKSILPLIVSGGIAGGCAVPGIMSTRTMREEKDRLTTMLVAPLMNCGAKMPVHILLIGAFFIDHKAAVLWGLVLFAWLMALVASWCLRRTVTRGEQAPFVMELPPYHVPNLKSVTRSATQRTWSFVRKAGTLILGVTLLLWAMMYYPHADTAAFDAERAAAGRTLQTTALANDPTVAAFLAPNEIEKSVAFWNATKAVQAKHDATDRLAAEDEIAKEYAKRSRVFLATAAKSSDTEWVKNRKVIAHAFNEYCETLREIDARESAAVLAYSIAGRLGRALEPVSRYAGFDWRDNIALIGGFAAKEVVVTTLGLAYSMGEVETPDADDATAAAEHSLAKRLHADKTWSPRRALAMMVFVLIYAPCLATVAVMWRESGSWKWPAFASAYSTVLAYVLAVSIFQLGGWLGFS